MLKRMIENEIAYEKMLLTDLEKKLQPSDDMILTCSRGYFHYRRRNSSSKLKYISRSEQDLLRRIAVHRYRSEKAKLLRANINTLTSVLHRLSDYDDETIIKRMPKAYSTAINVLRNSAALEEIVQSENPKYRDALIIKASDGLYVRTKGELSLYETLKSYDLKVRYEKRLILKEKLLLPNGKITVKDVEAFPDFTIGIPDGSEIYWELNGLYDNPGYRHKQFRKFNLYYDNGIYIPKNLIVTMESADKPLDLMTIRRIIEAQILPLMK